jgi:hypothetical protein
MKSEKLCFGENPALHEYWRMARTAGQGIGPEHPRARRGDPSATLLPASLQIKSAGGGAATRRRQ